MPISDQALRGEDVMKDAKKTSTAAVKEKQTENIFFIEYNKKT